MVEERYENVYEEISHGADFFGVSKTFMMQIAFLIEFQELNRLIYNHWEAIK